MDFSELSESDCLVNEVKGHVDCNKYVYHYTTAQTAIEHILYKGTIRFSPFSRVNDPRENKSRGFTFSLSNKEEEEMYAKEGRNIGGQADNLFWHNNKVLCFSCDDKKINYVEDTNKNFYRGCCRPRMWAQYADNHKGVCLKFDRVQLNRIIKEYANKEKLRFVFQGKVKYSNQSDYLCRGSFLNFSDIMQYGLESYLFKYHFRKYKNDLFFLKTLDWRDEIEYRWVCPGKDDAYLEIPFGNALSEIFVGEYFHSSYLPSLKKLNETYDVCINRVNWGSGYPQVFRFLH